MGWLSRWAVRRPAIAIVSWFIFLGAIAGVGQALAGEFNDSFELPNTESTKAQELLTNVSGAEEATTATARIVFSPVTPDVASLLQEVAGVEGVACVTNPFDPTKNFGSACAAPQGLPDFSQLPAEQQQVLQGALAAAAKASSPISADGKVGYSTVTFTSQELSSTTSKELTSLVEQANTDALTVGATGLFVVPEPPKSEAIGIAVALVILLIAFGSVIAAGLPIITAVIGLGGGLALVTVAAKFLDVATFAPTIGAMIGLGVGIDYALFILNRYRQAVNAGHDLKDSILEAVNTAGRSVMFAGVTVIIAVSGLYVLGIGFFTGLAVAATVTVVMVMLSALWLLPAVISALGKRALGLKIKAFNESNHKEGRRLAHYGTVLQRRPWIPLIGALLVGSILAIPTMSLRLGFADDSGQKLGSPARTAYDLLADGFGPGINGPFFVAVELDNAGDTQSYAAAVTAFANTEGVARTNPTVEMIPLVIQPDTKVTAIQIIPESAPQDEATSALLERLRSETIPGIESQVGLQAYVGGFTAVVADFTNVLTDALPLFLTVVVGLGFLALVLLFRSIIVPLTAAVTSLLSLGVALGVTVAVFQWGWFSEALNVTSTGPIFPFLPIMVFSILFGLAMDYHVFLASRMQEEWARTKDNKAAVRRGLAGSGRVVLIAAAIMSSVFLAFVPTDDATIKLFGLALGSAVITDAFLVRMVIVPSLMSILGKANWWLPAWLDRILPTIKVEHGEDEFEDDPELDEKDRVNA